MAQIQKGTTYITGDQVTAANLNALADSAILLPGAITDQTAKTVPLAADTILLHSAADTALRKSTLTQLFSNATGIPISTGVSGLGTGIATALAVNTGSAGAPVLFNGALGTPTSGTVTNLTGTASININGTVGATTASTGAFTTLSASGKISSNISTGAQFGVGGASSGQTVGYLHAYDTATTTLLVFDRSDGAVAGSLIYDGSGLIRFGTTTAHNLELMRGGTTIASISSTGLAVTGNISTSNAGNNPYVRAVDGSIITKLQSLTAGDTAGWVGTESNHAFRLVTNNTVRVTVDTSGNVGIGTTSPTAKLHVDNGTQKLVKTVTVNSSTQTIVTNSAEGVSGLLWVRDASVGGQALVLWDISVGITIVSQLGSIFTTSSPSATQIQLSTGGSSPYYVQAIAGATRNGDSLSVSAINNQ